MEFDKITPDRDGAFDKMSVEREDGLEKISPDRDEALERISPDLGLEKVSPDRDLGLEKLSPERDLELENVSPHRDLGLENISEKVSLDMDFGLEKVSPDRDLGLEKISPDRDLGLEKISPDRDLGLEKISPDRDLGLEKLSPERDMGLEKISPDRDLELERVSPPREVELDKITPDRDELDSLTPERNPITVFDPITPDRISNVEKNSSDSKKCTTPESKDEEDMSSFMLENNMDNFVVIDYYDSKNVSEVTKSPQHNNECGNPVEVIEPGSQKDVDQIQNEDSNKNESAKESSNTDVKERKDDKKQEERKIDEKKQDEKKQDEKKNGERSRDERKKDARRQDERKKDERRQDERKQDERRREERRQEEKKQDVRKQIERRQAERRHDERRRPEEHHKSIFDKIKHQLKVMKRRDPERSRRDIEKNKFTRTSHDILKKMESGLVPPGMELEVDIPEPIPKRIASPNRYERYPSKMEERDRESERWHQERRTEHMFSGRHSPPRPPRIGPGREFPEDVKGNKPFYECVVAAPYLLHGRSPPRRSRSPRKRSRSPWERIPSRKRSPPRRSRSPYRGFRSPGRRSRSPGRRSRSPSRRSRSPGRHLVSGRRPARPGGRPERSLSQERFIKALVQCSGILTDKNVNTPPPVLNTPPAPFPPIVPGMGMMPQPFHPPNCFPSPMDTSMGGNVAPPGVDFDFNIPSQGPPQMMGVNVNPTFSGFPPTDAPRPTDGTFFPSQSEPDGIPLKLNLIQQRESTDGSRNLDNPNESGQPNLSSRQLKDILETKHISVKSDELLFGPKDTKIDRKLVEDVEPLPTIVPEHRIPEIIVKCKRTVSTMLNKLRYPNRLIHIPKHVLPPTMSRRDKPSPLKRQPEPSFRFTSKSYNYGNIILSSVISTLNLENAFNNDTYKYAASLHKDSSTQTYGYECSTCIEKRLTPTCSKGVNTAHVSKVSVRTQVEESELASTRSLFTFNKPNSAPKEEIVSLTHMTPAQILIAELTAKAKGLQNSAMEAQKQNESRNKVNWTTQTMWGNQGDSNNQSDTMNQATWGNQAANNWSNPSDWNRPNTNVNQQVNQVAYPQYAGASSYQYEQAGNQSAKQPEQGMQWDSMQNNQGNPAMQRWVPNTMKRQFENFKRKLN